MGGGRVPLAPGIEALNIACTEACTYPEYIGHVAAKPLMPLLRPTLAYIIYQTDLPEPRPSVRSRTRRQLFARIHASFPIPPNDWRELGREGARLRSPHRSPRCPLAPTVFQGCRFEAPFPSVTTWFPLVLYKLFFSKQSAAVAA